MDISSTRLTSLLKEALTPQPVPTAKADPATAALVKALVQPPAPSAATSAQFAAQAFNGSLPRPPAHATQRLSSDQIEDAYRAVMEPEADRASAGVRPGRPATEAEQASRGPTSPQTAIADSMTRAAAAPTLPVSTIAVSSSVLVAANSNAPRPPGAAARPGSARSSQPSQPPLWMMSILTALLSATITTIALLLLR
ncbi:hypothetical protein RFM23_28630 [Mesorhizobium abyssinicae]|uniref:Uncharacterized protein n=1 Tax=Mesorhizobium abyssinicae TaxID=1209958 RepID=A0ABU5AWK6_9HYPH|nr:hypothetical protein [Mesorhizobium abyssinicae]MDX8541596.1 hypothetical protein [Mesorhizobium abyssinicae]